MSKGEYEKLVPAQLRGKGTELFTEKQMTDEESAVQLFHKAVDRMLHPQYWKDIASTGAIFIPCDHSGIALNRELKERDLIRINIPGPGPAAGDGYDWVKVAKLSLGNKAKGTDMEAALQLLTVPSPGDDGKASHFFKTGATSSFIITLRDNTVHAAYFGRNEELNNRTGKLLDDIRNTLVGAGALAGLSELQWQSLLDGFLGSEHEVSQNGAK